MKLNPLQPFDASTTPNVGRLSIDKHYHGDLEATGTGEMLTGTTGTRDSAGYVAVEHVNGTLNGRKGTFLLQHDGMMARGAQHLTVTVVPDSGTGELAGPAGTMTIVIADGKHSYEFDYTLGGMR